MPRQRLRRVGSSRPAGAVGLAMLCVVAAGLSGCSPYTALPPLAPPESRMTPDLTASAFLPDDGAVLPARAWLPPPAIELRAVALALHGFNDYSQTFAEAGPWLASKGIAVYAYDQRGFGAGPLPGEWAGGARMAADAVQAAAVLRQRHTGLPLYLFGESMGGAVAMRALAEAIPAAAVDGAVLSAPAVWGRSTMPWYQRLSLAISARLTPRLTVSGKGLDIWPSDNVEMLRALGRDPLVIKQSRIGTLHGLTDLMDDAYRIGVEGRLPGPVLWLYGERDEIVPPAPTLEAAAGLRQDHNQRFVLYPNGWHMLFRDLGGEVVLEDIAAWMLAPHAPLPFGVERDPASVRRPRPRRRRLKRGETPDT